MAIKFEKLEVGKVYYERHTHKMGNTTMRTLGEWPVRITSIDRERRTVSLIWNGNSHAPERWYERDLKRVYDWSMYDPDQCELSKSITGRVRKVRRLTKAERAQRQLEKKLKADAELAARICTDKDVGQ